jgi:hypothetical protein
MAGKFRFQPCQNCCGGAEPPVDCTAACVDKIAPAVFKVLLEGVVNGLCPNCDIYNGVWYPAFVSASEYACIWNIAVESYYDVCPDDAWGGWPRVTVTIGYNFGTSKYYLRVQPYFVDTTSGGQIDDFYLEQDAPFDCMNFDALDVPYLDTGGGDSCDISAATCTIWSSW